LNGSEVKVYTDDDDIKQQLAKGEKDNIWAIHETLSGKMLDEPQKEIAEIEIDVAAEDSYSPPPAYADSHAPPPAYAPSESSAYAPTQQYDSEPVVAAQPYQPQPFTFQVQCPAGIGPGMQIQVQHPKTGQMLIVAVPDGVAQGGLFNISA